MNFINLSKDNIESEHICCAISDKKCAESYQMKKEWLKQEFQNGYVFYRLDQRAKVFIEYGPGEKAWLPVSANNYLNINCFWVSGKYKGQGYGKKLLNQVTKDAGTQNRSGIYTVVGKKKFHFMSDGKWFLKQGFNIVDETRSGFVLLAKILNISDDNPRFNKEAKKGECPDKSGLVAYYTNRCPFAEYHIKNSLIKTAQNRKLPLKIIKIENLKQAQKSPTPATIFSLFYNGIFLTTDLSVCMENRFDKFWQKTA